MLRVTKYRNTKLQVWQYLVAQPKQISLLILFSRFNLQLLVKCFRSPASNPTYFPSVTGGQYKFQTLYSPKRSNLGLLAITTSRLQVSESDPISPINVSVFWGYCLSPFVQCVSIRIVQNILCTRKEVIHSNDRFPLK